ncbi:uncharacterized protein [Mytilus edulis]|uniref:uncharacterized protein n=1 Tax=Mytilus edulis TaxID=6550 RepID=UPI0039F04B6A
MYRGALVATVNIGEIYSGYTFFNKAGFEDDPRAVTSYGSWKSQYLMGLHTQTPTSILLNAEKGFESFGFEAEDQYISLSEDMENSDMYFFQHFLCQENWYREKSGKIFVKPSNRIGYVPLKTLLIHSVSYLKTHFLREAMIGDVLREDDILWVVVYPDESKFDVRFILLETFLNTGISRENIELLAESHAIQAFARYIEKPKKRENKRVPTESIIILNCTLTQICPNIAFHNYPKGITSAIGMSSIINDIDSILTKRLGCSLFSDVTDFHSRCDLYHYFDSSLREYSLNQFCSVRIPASCFQDLENHFTPSCNKGFKLIRGSLKIDKTVIHEVFQNALKPLMDHLKKEIIILNRETIRKVILVGDFSSYKMTKVVLQESFPQYEFIVPLDSEIAAPIGATIAGHEIRSDKYDSYIQYVPKMSIVGTWHIEPELLSTPSGLDNSLSGKPAATASMATTNVTDDNSNLSFLTDPIRSSKIAINLPDLYESEYSDSSAAFVENRCVNAKWECLL